DLPSPTPQLRDKIGAIRGGRRLLPGAGLAIAAIVHRGASHPAGAKKCGQRATQGRAVMTIVDLKSDAPRQDNVESVPKVEAAQEAAAADVKIAHSVAEIIGGVNDGGGERIDFVYFKRPNYAIYRRGAPPQVVVAYSDDKATADQQIVSISM